MRFHADILRCIRMDVARQVLDSFRERAESRLTAGELTEISKLPRRTVNDALLELVREKFIQQLGKGKGTYYQLVF